MVLAPRVRASAPEALAAYLHVLAEMNASGELRKYPGSPFIAAALMRPQDQLRLFELHPTDSRLLDKNVAGLPNATQIEVVRNNGFTGLKALLPPASRRALVLIDPSYELKTDYAQVIACLQDALQRFATGCYVVWYPVIPRQEAHQLPRRLTPWRSRQAEVGCMLLCQLAKGSRRADVTVCAPAASS